MRFLGLDPAGRPILEVPIYYDVRSNRIRLETFIGVAERYQQVAKSLVLEHIGIETELLFYVYAPESGSFRQVLGVVVVAGLGGWLGTGGADITRGFIEGLTGRSPEEWAFDVGENLRKSTTQSDSEKTDDGQETEDDISQSTYRAAEITAVIGNAAEEFLSTPTETLTERGFIPSELPNTFNARTELFYQLECDPQITGVGFGSEPVAPIRRQDFSRYQVRPTEREDEDLWKIELVKYRVSSPNWDRYDGRRKWKGRGVDGRFVYFTIEDEIFWELAKKKELESSVIDELIAQAAIRYVDGKPIDRVIVRVISFNDMFISREMTRDEIARFLSERNEKPGSGFLA